MNENEKPGQDAEVFVKAVKRKTRKYFGAEEKIRDKFTRVSDMLAALPPK